MTRYLLTLILLVTIQLSIFGQSKEDSLGVITDCKAYEKVKEQSADLSLKDSIIKYQNSQINTFGVYADSLKFELNNSIVDGKNLEQNAKKAVIYEKKKAALIKELLYVLIPIMVIESLLLIK